MALLRRKSFDEKNKPTEGEKETPSGIEGVNDSAEGVSGGTLGPPGDMGEPGEVVIKAKEEPVFNKKEELDVFFLKDFASKRGEQGIVTGLIRAIDYYHRIKSQGDWDSAPKIKIKNISNGVHNEGSWKVNPGEEILLPDFVVKKVVADFPDRLEIVD